MTERTSFQAPSTVVDAYDSGTKSHSALVAALLVTETRCRNVWRPPAR